MNKLKLLVLLVVFGVGTSMTGDKAFADHMTIVDNSSQEVNDEGYGKDDVEYNNSEDEQMNVDEPLPSENTNS